MVFPGENEVRVPVYLTNLVDLTSWQMGLDYDDLLVALVGIDFGGTVSETLAPSVQWDPLGAPYESLAVVYSVDEPFPAGEHQLAAWLTFTLVGGAQIPPGGNVVTEIAIVDADPFPILFANTTGSTVVPTASPGSVTLFAAPILLVGEEEGDFFGSTGTIEVPVYAWTNGPSTVIEMGLDYDDLLMCTFDLDGGAIAAAVGTNVIVTLADTGPHIDLRIQSTGTPFPPFDGDLIGHLVMILGPTPFAGEFPIVLVPGQSRIDLTPVQNLIDGGLTLNDHFVRADANFDGQLHISDAQSILGRVLLGTPIICDDSADTNDDGKLDISDPIFALNHMFLSGPPPAAPFPAAGPDPTPDPFGCL
jgi:hypothetical protein